MFYSTIVWVYKGEEGPRYRHVCPSIIPKRISSDLVPTQKKYIFSFFKSKSYIKFSIILVELKFLFLYIRAFICIKVSINQGDDFSIHEVLSSHICLAPLSQACITSSSFRFVWSASVFKTPSL